MHVQLFAMGFGPLIIEAIIGDSGNVAPAALVMWGLIIFGFLLSSIFHWPLMMKVIEVEKEPDEAGTAEETDKTGIEAEKGASATA